TMSSYGVDVAGMGSVPEMRSPSILRTISFSHLQPHPQSRLSRPANSLARSPASSAKIEAQPFGDGTLPWALGRLAFAEFVACEVAEAVIGGVFVHFAEGGVVEDLLDEFVDSETVVEDHCADVDQLGGVFADNADAQEFLAARRED